jgi:hypothetical protein
MVDTRTQGCGSCSCCDGGWGGRWHGGLIFQWLLCLDWPCVGLAVVKGGEGRSTFLLLRLNVQIQNTKN